MRCLIDTPLFVQRGQTVSGCVILTSNKRQSYNVDMELVIDGIGTRAANSLDLKNPYFRYTGQPPQPPPGCQEVSPSEQYWQTLDTNQLSTQTMNSGANSAMNGVVVMNGNTQLNSVIDINNMQLQQPSANTINTLNAMNTLNNINNHQPHAMQLGVHPSSLISSNLGSLPSPGTTSRSSPHGRVTPAAVPTSSIGGGISPSFFSVNTPPVAVLNSSNFPVNNSLMIGDYAVTPQNLILPTQNVAYKPH